MLDEDAIRTFGQDLNEQRLPVEPGTVYMERATEEQIISHSKTAVGVFVHARSHQGQAKSLIT